MNFPRASLVALLLAAVARAGYAPAPDRNEGKVWTASLRTGVGHDDNIFGTSASPLASTVFSVAPKFGFNGSLTDTTYATFSYQLTMDTFTERPGSKTVLSHDLFARLAHAFTQVTNLDVNDTFQIAKNPETLLNGIAPNAGQAYQRNQIDARLNTHVSEKVGLQVKARNVLYRFENAALAGDIDRNENLYGLALSYDARPDTVLVAEYRHQDVLYRQSSGNKDKRSEFVIVGADYLVAKKLSAGAHLGYEWRRRDRERATEAPTADFSVKYDYADQSYLAAGYSYALEETSNINIYTDSKVHRLFVNAQHALSALVVASASASYEPSSLQGRLGQRGIAETAVRFGAALHWLPTKNWSFSANFDRDDVESDEVVRSQRRTRYGVAATFTF